MGNTNHLKLQVHGGNKGAAMVGEEWAFTVSLEPRLSNTAPEPIFTPGAEFDAQYVAASVSGTPYVGVSNFHLEGGLTDINILEWLDQQVRPAVVAYIGTSTLFSDQAYVDSITCWPIASTGRVVQLPVGAAYAEITPTDNSWDGGASGSAVAPYSTVAVSKLTDANVPRGRGRFYPPPVAAANLDTSGLLTQAKRLVSANAAKAFLEGIQYAGGSQGSLWPIVIGAPFTTAYLITSVAVDNVPDTQRRRKASLLTVRDTVALTY